MDEKKATENSGVNNEPGKDLVDRVCGALWFTEHGTSRPIGMVLVRQPTGRFRGYVGNCFGTDEDADRRYIARYGARLPAKVLPALFSINPELAE